MNPFPGTSWPSYLNYTDPDQVQLNLAVIIAEGTRLRRRRRLAKAAAAALVCGIVPTAVIIEGRGLAPQRAVTAQQAAARAGTYRLGIDLRQSSVRAAVRLPHRYQRVSSLVGDLARPGVWFWGTAESRISLFHLNRNGAMTTWPVLPLSSRLRAGSASGFAVTATGVAWLGLNSTLIRVETRTGRVRSWNIPASRAGGTGRPAVDALAASSDGQIAVAMSHSSAIQVFSQRTGRFTEVRLPAQADQARSMAFARNGTLGVSFTEPGHPGRAGVYLLPRTGPLFVATVDDATGVTPYGAGSLIVGVARPDLVTSTARVTRLVGPGDLANLDVATSAPAQLPDNKLSMVVGPGYLSYPAGAASVRAAKTSSVLYLAAPNSCGTVTVKLPGSGATQPTEPAPSSCPWPFRLLASDSAGDVWVVPAASKRTVQLLQQ
jgi:sugar lactone lactonase YvrE